MDNEKWINQIRSLILLPRAMWRLIGLSLLLHIIGIVLGAIFNIGILVIVITAFFGLIWFFPYWQPAYSVIYWIAGNKSVSPLLESRTLKWWHYVSLMLKLAFLVCVLYFGLTLLFK